MAAKDKKLLDKQKSVWLNRLTSKLLVSRKSRKLHILLSLSIVYFVAPNKKNYVLLSIKYPDNCVSFYLDIVFTNETITYNAIVKTIKFKIDLTDN